MSWGLFYMHQYFNIVLLHKLTPHRSIQTINEGQEKMHFYKSIHIYCQRYTS